MKRFGSSSDPVEEPVAFEKVPVGSGEALQEAKRTNKPIFLEFRCEA